jgi:hypothetical protein
MISRVDRAVVYEVTMGTQRPGWAIVRGTVDPHGLVEHVVAVLNRQAARTAYGVVCADLMRGYDISLAGL